MEASPRFVELPPGHALGRYTVVRLLGKGGMGVVYVARDERLGREVALKLFDERNESATRERLWREARAAARVTHPNICQVYEVEETPQGIHLAMELLLGEPLDVRLQRGAMPPAEATRAALEMLAALGALHARGLVHRDIKPSHVFCTPHGLKVLDFGLSRASAMAVAGGDSGDVPQVTRTGLITGTPRYMAPEQLTGEAPVARRDVPANGRAFELFLRGLEVVNSLQQAPEARRLFSDAVGVDPLFAPAWAALGRCHRVGGKYFGERADNDRLAEDAFRRALALSPELPMAHRWLTHLESEQGRADLAVARLLGHAKVNRNDAQLFAGLVHALRYAGLIEASLAAHAEARRLDPTVPTSVECSLMLAGDVDRLLGLLLANEGEVHRDALLVLLCLAASDPRVREIYRGLDASTRPRAYVVTVEAMYWSAFGTAAEGRAALETCIAVHADPEAFFLVACGYLRIGDVDRAMELLARVVGGGFVPLGMLAAHPLFAPVRAHAAWPAIEADARRRVAMARAIFERGKGGELLGL